MLLKEKISADFIVAYKNKEMDKKNFLGVLKGAIQAQEGRQIESTDENVLKVVKSIEKGINETISAKQKLGEDTSIQQLELTYLSAYLPTLMSENEIRFIVKEILARENINVKNEGFLTGLFNKENKEKSFDNKVVIKVIKEEIETK